MALAYYQHKISHNGICTYKVFEGFNRKYNQNSAANLVQSDDRYYTTDSTAKMRICPSITPSTSRKIFKTCQKLAYYSCTRKFTNSKQKEFSMKVAFLTLTAPENYTTQQINTAFESFLDYLTRTGNCRYVYKKEVGYKSGKFHIHLMINNFIPYYIVSWKWKRLLMFQNPDWPKNDAGKDYNSHTRIELPRSKKMAAAYIAKYMTKEGFITEPVGRLWGASKCINDCKELILIENDIPIVEYHKLIDCRKVIQDDFMTFVCVDWFKSKDIAPDLYKMFLRQYYKFTEVISLEQKFKFC